MLTDNGYSPKPIIRCTVNYVPEKQMWVVEIYKNEKWQSENWFHTQPDAINYADEQRLKQ